MSFPNSLGEKSVEKIALAADSDSNKRAAGLKRRDKQDRPSSCQGLRVRDIMKHLGEITPSRCCYSVRLHYAYMHGPLFLEAEIRIKDRTTEPELHTVGLGLSLESDTYQVCKPVRTCSSRSTLVRLA